MDLIFSGDRNTVDENTCIGLYRSRRMTDLGVGQTEVHLLQNTSARHAEITVNKSDSTATFMYSGDMRARRY